MAESDNIFNPSTGISDFVNPKKKVPNISEPEDWRKAVYKEAVQLKKQEIVNRSAVVKAQPSKPFLARYGFVPRKRQVKPIQDRLKVMRLSNMLEKKRLQNQIQKMKLQRQVEILRKKGQLKQVINQPIMRTTPTWKYPAYSTPEMNADIDSAFTADMSGKGDFWGNEQYYDEQYYNEDYYGNEFTNSDPFYQLAIKVRSGVNPLLW